MRSIKSALCVVLAILLVVSVHPRSLIIASSIDGDFVRGASALTNAGAVPFVISTGTVTDDPTGFFWDAANQILSLGTATPVTTVASKLHLRTGTDQNYAFGGPVTLATGVALHALNNAVTANVGLELRGFPIMLFPAGASNPGVIIGRQPTTAQALAHISQHVLGNAVERLESVATNDDPMMDVFQNRVTTTNATVATLHTVAIPASKTVTLVAYINARRTGGAAGTAEDGWGYCIAATFKNVAGTATQIGSTTPIYGHESQAAFAVAFTASGGNVLIEVTGAADNDVVWHLSKLEYMQVGT